MKAKKLHLFEYNCLSYFLIRGSFIGICISNLFIVTKQDSWISIILAAILGFIPLFVYYKIVSSNLSVNDFINKYCGKILGSIINILILLFTLLFISMVLWNLINFISSQYLYKTPNLIISIMFAFSLYYITTKNINVIGRIAVILFYISSLLYLLSILGLSFQLDVNGVKPIFEFGFNPIFNVSLSFISYNILPLFLLTVIPKDEISNPKNLLKNEIIFYLITILSLFIVVFFLLSIYGIEVVQILQYPTFHVLKRISLAGFIERLESVLSIQWILDMFMLISIGLFFIKTSLQKILKIDFPKITSFILVTFLVIITHYLFENNTVGNVFILKYMPPLILFFYFIIPTIIHFTKKISQK